MSWPVIKDILGENRDMISFFSMEFHVQTAKILVGELNKLVWQYDHSATIHVKIRCNVSLSYLCLVSNAFSIICNTLGLLTFSCSLPKKKIYNNKNWYTLGSSDFLVFFANELCWHHYKLLLFSQESPCGRWRIARWVVARWY